MWKRPLQAFRRLVSSCLHTARRNHDSALCRSTLWAGSTSGASARPQSEVSSPCMDATSEQTSHHCWVVFLIIVNPGEIAPMRIVPETDSESLLLLILMNSDFWLDYRPDEVSSLGFRVFLCYMKAYCNHLSMRITSLHSLFFFCWWFVPASSHTDWFSFCL